MNITREQVSAAYEALGFDPNLAHTVTITPTHVHSSVIVLVDGHPNVKYGQTLMEHETTEIVETPVAPA